MKREEKYKILLKAGAACFVAAILIIGTTLASLSNKDKVTNTQEGKEIRILLLEPEWQKSGQKDAKKLEPGMEILKDPYVLNNSEDSVYVRMKIVIKDEKGTEIDMGEERYQSILKALYLSDSLEDNEQAKEVPLIDKIEGEEGDLKITLNSMSDFFYEDGWFYYGSSSEEEKTYTSLAAGDSTSKLFNKLVVPIYREKAKTVLGDDSLLIYDGIFDTPFTIEIIAQGISSRTEKDEILNKFNTDFSEVSSQ